MVTLFKDRSPIAIVWLILLSFAVHGNFIFSPPALVAHSNDGFLSLLFHKYAGTINSLFLVVIYHIIIIIQSVSLNTIFTNNKMFYGVNHLVAMVYILLTGIIDEWGLITPALLINTLVIWLFSLYIQLYNQPNAKTLIFNIGLLTGIAILLYHPSALLVFAALFSVMVVRTFVITEWFVLFMGVFTSFYFLFSYLFITDRLSTYINYIPHWQLHLPAMQHSIDKYVAIGLFIIITLVGFVCLDKENKRLVIQIRKSWGLLVAMFIILLPVPFVSDGAGLDSFFLWLVPASAIIAKGFFVPKTNTLPNLMFWSLFLLSVLIGWKII